MTNQRQIKKAIVGACAALAMTLGFVGSPVVANAATAPGTPRAESGFPEDSVLFKHTLSGKCLTPNTPSYVGSLTVETCEDINQYFLAFTFDGKTHILPLWGDTPDGELKCLFGETNRKVYTQNCTDAANSYWQLVGNAIKNPQAGRCLNAEDSGAVNLAACDGTDRRNWEFASLFSTVAPEAGQTLVDAQRAAVESARSAVLAGAFR